MWTVRLSAIFLMAATGLVPASADLIIDNFTTHIPTVSAGGIGTTNGISPSGAGRRLFTGAGVTSLGSTNQITMTASGNRSFELVYDLTSARDLATINNVLRFSYSANNTSVSGNGFVFRISALNSFNKAAPGNTLATVTRNVSVGSNAGVVKAHASELGGTAVMGNVRYLSIRVERSNAAQGNVPTVFSFTNQSFTAAPEPASLTLLGLTGFVGWLGYRRRGSRRTRKLGDSDWKPGSV